MGGSDAHTGQDAILCCQDMREHWCSRVTAKEGSSGGAQGPRFGGCVGRSAICKSIHRVCACSVEAWFTLVELKDAPSVSAAVSHKHVTHGRVNPAWLERRRNVCSRPH